MAPAARMTEKREVTVACTQISCSWDTDNNLVHLMSLLHMPLLTSYCSLLNRQELCRTVLAYMASACCNNHVPQGSGFLIALWCS